VQICTDSEPVLLRAVKILQGLLSEDGIWPPLIKTLRDLLATMSYRSLTPSLHSYVITVFWFRSPLPSSPAANGVRTSRFLFNVLHKTRLFEFRGGLGSDSEFLKGFRQRDHGNLHPLSAEMVQFCHLVELCTKGLSLVTVHYQILPSFVFDSRPQGYE
jgi:hypothetical protein